MNAKINRKKALLAEAASLGLVIPLALQAPVAAQPHRAGGGSFHGGGAAHFSGGSHYSGGSHFGGAAFHGSPGIRGNYGSGRAFVAGNDHDRFGHWHGTGIWYNGHYGYWDGGIFINLNAPFYGGPGYYGYPAYVGTPDGVYVHFHGTVQGVDVNDGYLGIAGDNGVDYNVQTPAAASFGPGERVVVHGTAYGNTVNPTVLHEERPR